MTTMTLEALRSLVADDVFASTFQSVSQYRGALLRQFDNLVEITPISAAEDPVASNTASVLKLQVKDSGAWRNVLSFASRHIRDVKWTSAALLKAAGSEKTALRICEGDQVLAYCEQPACEWRVR
ncbi:hypothetical protein [Massilia sp. YIM B02443]|uniref:hypothetical protein n=1 Tax=Massilia sp. YIM B02443 TaxID=3050127 RepID=UPI0025B6D711|nr:hypothetical protein [Massilia sp. YIM B02443]MDN4036772.1 hypothetical protein [Massilia sp. YIM B02443]